MSAPTTAAPNPNTAPRGLTPNSGITGLMNMLPALNVQSTILGGDEYKAAGHSVNFELGLSNNGTIGILNYSGDPATAPVDIQAELSGAGQKICQKFDDVNGVNNVNGAPTEFDDFNQATDFMSKIVEDAWTDHDDVDMTFGGNMVVGGEKYFFYTQTGTSKIAIYDANGKNLAAGSEPNKVYRIQLENGMRVVATSMGAGLSFPGVKIPSRDKRRTSDSAAGNIMYQTQNDDTLDKTVVVIDIGEVKAKNELRESTLKARLSMMEADVKYKDSLAAAKKVLNVDQLDFDDPAFPDCFDLGALDAMEATVKANHMSLANRGDKAVVTAGVRKWITEKVAIDKTANDPRGSKFEYLTDAQIEAITELATAQLQNPKKGGNANDFKKVVEVLKEYKLALDGELNDVRRNKQPKLAIGARVGALMMSGSMRSSGFLKRWNTNTKAATRNEARKGTAFNIIAGGLIGAWAVARMYGSIKYGVSGSGSTDALTSSATPTVGHSSAPSSAMTTEVSSAIQTSTPSASGSGDVLASASASPSASHSSLSPSASASASASEQVTSTPSASASANVSPSASATPNASPTATNADDYLPQRSTTVGANNGTTNTVTSAVNAAPTGSGNGNTASASQHYTWKVKADGQGLNSIAAHELNVAHIKADSTNINKIVDQIVAENRIKNRNLIHAGSVLKMDKAHNVIEQMGGVKKTVTPEIHAKAQSFVETLADQKKVSAKVEATPIQKGEGVLSYLKRIGVDDSVLRGKIERAISTDPSLKGLRDSLTGGSKPVSYMYSNNGVTEMRLSRPGDLTADQSQKLAAIVAKIAKDHQDEYVRLLEQSAIAA